MITSKEISFDDLDTPLDNVGPAAKISREDISIHNGGEKALTACIKCGGSGQTRWGRCFRCDGKGRISVRSAAASKAKVTAEQNKTRRMVDFTAAHGDVLEFLGANSDWSEFYKALRDQFLERGSLSENQIAAVRRGMAKIAERRETKQAEREAARPTIEISAIQALFANAAEKLVKRPIFRTETLQIETDRQVGLEVLWVKDHEQDRYVGKIVDGKFNAFRAATAATLPALLAVAADPTAEAIKYADKFNACAVCGQTLRDPVSRLAVIGPICAKKWGLDHLRLAAAGALAAEKAGE